MVKPRKPAASSATVKKAKTMASSPTADRLDTLCYSQKSRQNNDSGNLDILDIGCAMPTVSSFLSLKEKMSFAMSVSCVDGCEGQPTDWTSRFGVKPSCSRCEEPICGCNDKMKDFKFCPDCEDIFCGRCVVNEGGNFEGECDFGGCKISGCSDCQWGSGKLAICSLCDSAAFCENCGTSCEFCPKRYCRVECALECDCEGLRQYYDERGYY